MPLKEPSLNEHDGSLWLGRDQILPLPEDHRLTGFGRETLFHYPWIVVSEPFYEEQGRVWILHHRNRTAWHVLTRLSRPHTPNGATAVGFGGSIACVSGWLLLADTGQGVLYGYKMKSRSSLQPLFVAPSLTAIKRIADASEGRIELETVNKETGEPSKTVLISRHESKWQLRWEKIN